MSLESLRTHTEQKITSLLRQIEEIKSSEFPHEDSKLALVELANGIRLWHQILRKVPSPADGQLILDVCTRANLDVFRLLPILGFILRSTNVRNSFEFFDPLKRLARQLLGDNAKLILSSEWYFSPMTYPMTVKELPDFALIGLPASESENALIIPLAGHELGHSVWRKLKLEDKLKVPIQNRIRTLFLNNWTSYEVEFGPSDKSTIDSDLQIFANRSEAFNFALSQCAEIFCDLLGIRIFGESFLHAFQYLLAPGSGRVRSVKYPKIKQRVVYMTNAMPHFGLTSSRDFTSVFQDEKPIGDKKTIFKLEMADKAAEETIPDLLKEIDNIAQEKMLPKVDKNQSEEIARSFRVGVPCDGPRNLADIIQAGWLETYDSAEKPDGHPLEHFKGLNEILFKSIEVSEYWTRINR